MKLYVVAVIVILGLYSTTAMADGCIRTSTGIMYTTMTSTKYTGGAVSNPHSLYCIRLTGSGTCTVRLSGTDYSGKLVTYVPPIGCPIDDYVNILLVLIGMAGYMVLKIPICNVRSITYSPPLSS